MAGMGVGAEGSAMKLPRSDSGTDWGLVPWRAIKIIHKRLGSFGVMALSLLYGGAGAVAKG
jgi:hypothetical protein